MEGGGEWGDLLAAGAVHGEVAGLLLGGDEPGDQRADEAEDWGEGGGDHVLLLPHEG